MAGRVAGKVAFITGAARGHRREQQRQLPLASDQVRGDPIVGGRQAEGLGHLIVLPASTVSSRPVT